MGRSAGSAFKSSKVRTAPVSNPYASAGVRKGAQTNRLFNPYASKPSDNPYASTYVNPYTASLTKPIGANPKGSKVNNPYASNAAQSNVIKDHRAENVSKKNAKRSNDFERSLKESGPPTVPNPYNANGTANVPNPYGPASALSGGPKATNSYQANRTANVHNPYDMSTDSNLYHADGTAKVPNPYGSASTTTHPEVANKVKNKQTVIVNNNMSNVNHSLHPPMHMSMGHTVHYVEPMMPIEVHPVSMHPVYRPNTVYSHSGDSSIACCCCFMFILILVISLICLFLFVSTRSSY